MIVRDDYAQAREREERRAAAAAKDVAARHVHLELAERYARLAIGERELASQGVSLR